MALYRGGDRASALSFLLMLYLVSFSLSLAQIVNDFFVRFANDNDVQASLLKANNVPKHFSSQIQIPSSRCKLLLSYNTISAHIITQNSSLSKNITMSLPKSENQVGPGSISVYAWVCIAGAILFVLIITGIAVKTIRGRRLQRKQQRLEDGNAIFGPIIRNPITK